MENLVKQHRQIQFINKLFPSDWWDNFEADSELYVEALVGQLMRGRVAMNRMASKYDFSMEDIDRLKNKGVIEMNM